MVKAYGGRKILFYLLSWGSEIWFWAQEFHKLLMQQKPTNVHHFNGISNTGIL